MAEQRNPIVALWSGRVVSTLVILALIADAAVNLFAPRLLSADMAAEGFPADLSPLLGTLMLLCAAIYAYPRTAVLGAILVTGFFGGAISIHLRLGAIGSPPQFICLALGALAWLGLFLRDNRVRALLPMKHVVRFSEP